jgi:hypothetical protein
LMIWDMQNDFMYNACVWHVIFIACMAYMHIKSHSKFRPKYSMSVKRCQRNKTLSKF